jgi:tyrosine-protein kinase
MNQTTPAPEALDARAYLQPIWRRKWLILAVTVLAAAGTYFISDRQTKQYVTSAQVYVQVADPVGAVGNPSIGAVRDDRSLRDVATLFTARPVLEGVAQRLGGQTGSVSVSPQTGSNFLTVTAKSPNPQLAAKLVDTYVSVFLDQRREQVTTQARNLRLATQRTLRALPNTAAGRDARSDALNTIQGLQAVEQNPNAGARQINPAPIPAEPDSPKPTRNAIFGAILGLIVGVALAYGLELLDRRMLRVSTVESILDLPVLAALPHVRDPSPFVDGRPAIPHGFLESFRSLRVNIQLAGVDQPGRTLIVTSALPQEGKSTVARDLALVHQEAGERVLVVDADLRHPAMAKLFGVDSELGLAQVLDGSATFDEAVVRGGASRATAGNGSRPSGSTDVLTHGKRVENPLVLLASGRLRTVLDVARGRYDVIIIDTAPVLVVTDAVPMLELVDGVVLVSRLGQSTRQAADRLRELLGRVPKARVIGAVANDMRQSYGDEGYGTYGYGYGYTASPD